VPNPPNPAPVEKFASLIRWLTHAVAAMSGGDRLSYLLIGLITERLRRINQCVKRIAAFVGDGKYAPRRFAPHRPPADPKPRPPNQLPQKFGWLLPLVPEAVQYRAQVEHLLLRDPAMAALIAAAPAPMARVLRPLCWMLRLEPPPILARPRAKPAPPRPKTSPRSRRSPPPDRQPAPAATASPPARSAAPGQTRGPPRPA